jgi:hypothetical protein
MKKTGLKHFLDLGWLRCSRKCPAKESQDLNPPNSAFKKPWLLVKAALPLCALVSLPMK